MMLQGSSFELLLLLKEVLAQIWPWRFWIYKLDLLTGCTNWIWVPSEYMDGDRPEESQPTEGRATLDHIFMRPRGRWRVVSKQVVRVVDINHRSVSDHYGLAVTLEAASTP
jgi:hypothetical protein